jgi:hypothetical protein
MFVARKVGHSAAHPPGQEADPQNPLKQFTKSILYSMITSVIEAKACLRLRKSHDP